MLTFCGSICPLLMIYRCCKEQKASLSPQIKQTAKTLPCRDLLICLATKVKWRKPVIPGDVLVMEMELVKWKPKFGLAKMSGKGYVDGVLAVEVQEFTFALVKEP